MVGRKIAVYADGADLKTMAALYERCDGCTTNPSLMKKAGITDYRAFAREVLAIWQQKPVSFEVLADDIEGIVRQATDIASWGKNVFIKVPVLNVRGDLNFYALQKLSQEGMRINVTAIMTPEQARRARDCMSGPGHIFSVFAGRIADTGQDPVASVIQTRGALGRGALILWASARQAYSVIEAETARADIITLTPDLIAKLDGFGRDLDEYSRETVAQFIKDAEGITL